MKRVKWGKKKAKKRAEISEEKGKANSSKEGCKKKERKREKEGSERELRGQRKRAKRR